MTMMNQGRKMIMMILLNTWVAGGIWCFAWFTYCASKGKLYKRDFVGKDHFLVMMLVSFIWFLIIPMWVMGWIGENYNIWVDSKVKGE